MMDDVLPSMYTILCHTTPHRTAPRHTTQHNTTLHTAKTHLRPRLRLLLRMYVLVKLRTIVML